MRQKKTIKATPLNKSFSKTLPNRFDHSVIDAAKGILILFVILGHSTNFWTPEPFATFSIKFFHVACFLLFPFIYDVKKIDGVFFKDRFARYYIPFTVFLLGYSILYFIAFKDTSDAPQWLGDVGKAFIFGTAPVLDNASGLRALWFLPTLMSIVLLCAFLIGNLKIHIGLLLLITFALHITVGLIPLDMATYLPLGLVNSLYLLFLGFFIRYITHYHKGFLEKIPLLFLALAVIAIGCAYYFDTLIKFPVMALPDITTPDALLIHGVIIISTFLFLITTPFFKNNLFLKWCGRNSLILYLSHLFFLAVAMQFFNGAFDNSTINTQSTLIVAFIFITAFAGGTACVFILNHSKFLNTFVTPRSWDEWTSLFRKKL